MTTEVRPAHSPLGASGAERWMNCPGSVGLLKELHLPETDEPEWRSLGTSAHGFAHTCLVTGSDGWEHMGEQFGHHTVDMEMATAVQEYLDECRRVVTENPGGTVYDEFGVDAPDFHKDFYGTLDRGYVCGQKLWIRDFKYGEGIAVDVAWNPQIMYYAYGLLRHHPEVQEVDLGIVQPRGFHPDGPVRLWPISADAIRTWAEDTLKPAMDRTAIDYDLDAGPWCRFCPAKLVCPLMVSLFGAAAQANPKQIVELSDESLGRSYQYKSAVMSYIKAMEEETFRRLNNGQQVPFVKLVQKKANRVWNSDAAALAKAKFGDDAMTTPELRSPAELEKIGSEAKAFTREHAYTPLTGLTVALESDKRGAVKVTTTTETFGASLKALDLA